MKKEKKRKGEGERREGSGREDGEEDEERQDEEEDWENGWWSQKRWVSYHIHVILCDFGKCFISLSCSILNWEKIKKDTELVKDSDDSLKFSA